MGATRNPFPPICCTQHHRVTPRLHVWQVGSYAPTQRDQGLALMRGTSVKIPFNLQSIDKGIVGAKFTQHH